MVAINNTVSMTFGGVSKEFPVIKDPIPHIKVKSKKELHGWWDSKESNGARECTSERLLINPYNGCSHDCFFCYAHAFWGYFKLYREQKIITVFEDFDRIIAHQLDNLLVASCGYLSPVTDPFQPINNKYHLSEKIMGVFVERNLPIDVVTKNIISNKAIKFLSEQEHSFAQVSILTLDESIRQKLVLGGGATTDELFKNLERLLDHGIFSVCRIDPIIPYLTDNQIQLKELISRLKDIGVNHLIFSCMDIPFSLSQDIYSNFEKIDPKIAHNIKKSYTERIKNSFHANIEYRKTLFSKLKKISTEFDISMALCMEFEKNENSYSGLNRKYMTSINCEGIDVPIYMRYTLNDKFMPASCKGNCLTCTAELVCDIGDLKNAQSWKLKDYRRWSKEKHH